MENKIVVIGCGNVGMAYIYALLNQINAVTEIVLIDTDERRIEGEVMDLNHTLALSPNPVRFKVGDYEDCKTAKIICITAGASQSLDSRMNGLKENYHLFQSIISSIQKSGFSGIYLIATNPLDVMSYFTYQLAGVHPDRVIGSGTILDTARLHYVLAHKLNIHPKSIEGYVLGEHGDSQFVPWNSVKVALQDIHDFLSDAEMSMAEQEVREAGYEIVKRKGATYYGIGMSLARITAAILKDEKIVLPISCYNKETDIFFSKPAVIGKEGVESKIYVKLTEEEQVKLDHSISVIKKAIQSVER